MMTKSSILPTLLTSQSVGRLTSLVAWNHGAAVRSAATSLLSFGLLLSLVTLWWQTGLAPPLQLVELDSYQLNRSKYASQGSLLNIKY